MGLHLSQLRDKKCVALFLTKTGQPLTPLHLSDLIKWQYGKTHFFKLIISFIHSQYTFNKMDVALTTKVTHTVDYKIIFKYQIFSCLGLNSGRIDTYQRQPTVSVTNNNYFLKQFCNFGFIVTQSIIATCIDFVLIIIKTKNYIL